MPSLIGPDDAALYRFRVLEGGKGRLRDPGPDRRPVRDPAGRGIPSPGTGQIFVRDLKPGLYYFLVGSPGGTQRYAPVVYGMAGNDMDIPDDVIRSYRGE